MSLKAISLAAAVLGIVAIILLSSQLEPKLVKISELGGNMVGEYVRVSGDISSIKQTKITSFTIKDDSSSVYAFSYDRLNLTKGRYEVSGKVNEYHGIMEIEISSIGRTK